MRAVYVCVCVCVCVCACVFACVQTAVRGDGRRVGRLECIWYSAVPSIYLSAGCLVWSVSGVTLRDPQGTKLTLQTDCVCVCVCVCLRVCEFFTRWWGVCEWIEVG